MGSISNWTLMLLKPDIVSHPQLLKILINDITTAGIEISGASLLRLTPEKAQKLYGIHKGKFFYPRLVRHVCSGPVIAMRVRGDVRAALGSSKLWPLPVNNIVENDVNEPSIRQRLSLSDVRNVAHTSDAEFAAKELAIFEPFESPMTLLDQILSEQIVHKSTAQELHMSN